MDLEGWKAFIVGFIVSEQASSMVLLSDVWIVCLLIPSGCQCIHLFPVLKALRLEVIHQEYSVDKSLLVSSIVYRLYGGRHHRSL